MEGFQSFLQGVIAKPAARTSTYEALPVTTTAAGGTNTCRAADVSQIDAATEELI